MTIEVEVEVEEQFHKKGFKQREEPFVVVRKDKNRGHAWYEAAIECNNQSIPFTEEEKERVDSGELDGLFDKNLEDHGNGLTQRDICDYVQQDERPPSMSFDDLVEYSNGLDLSEDW